MESPTYSVKQVSKITGLSSSVLRIWELRYGWPRPHRKINGYRVYNQFQVNDLTRLASFIKEGMAISSLVVDGMPRWPAGDASARSARTLSLTRALPAPADPAEAALQRDLIDALEHHRTPEVLRILDRIYWTVRPQDEPRTGLIPILSALAELISLGRPLPETGVVMAAVAERCRQLLRMQRISPDALAIVPGRGGTDALAALVAVMLCHRGIAARPWTQPGLPNAPFIEVADAESATQGRKHQLATLTLRGGAGTQGLVELLDPACMIAGLPPPSGRT